MRQNFKTGFECETRRDISKRNSEAGSDRLQKLARGMILLGISWYDIIFYAVYNWVWLYFQVLFLSLLFEILELKYKAVPLSTLKAYWRSRGMAPVILNFNTRWRWVVSFTLQPHHPWYPLSRRLVGLQDELWPHRRKFKSLISWGIKLQFHVHPVHTVDCKH